MHNSNFDAPVLRKKSIVVVSTKHRKLTNDKGNLIKRKQSLEETHLSRSTEGRSPAIRAIKAIRYM